MNRSALRRLLVNLALAETIGERARIIRTVLDTFTPCEPEPPHTLRIELDSRGEVSQ